MIAHYFLYVKENDDYLDGAYFGALLIKPGQADDGDAPFVIRFCRLIRAF